MSDFVLEYLHRPEEKQILDQVMSEPTDVSFTVFEEEISEHVDPQIQHFLAETTGRLPCGFDLVNFTWVSTGDFVSITLSRPEGFFSA